jgi:hypothetical protein
VQSETGCLVCGSPDTVKAHLFPRALVLDLRKSEKSLISADAVRPGYMYTQNGMWDRGILCKAHEDKAGRGDDYSIRLFRKLAEHPASGRSDGEFQSDNPNPKLLLAFAYSTVWKHVVSKYGREKALSLGPYENTIRNYLFADSDSLLDVMMTMNEMRYPDGEKFQYAESPFRIRMFGYSFWKFTVSSVDVWIKVDKRPLPSSWERYVANESNPMVVATTAPKTVEARPHLRTIARNLSASHPGWALKMLRRN